MTTYNFCILVGKTGLNTIANSVSEQGFQKAKVISNHVKDNLSVSNFGNETKLGSSKFQQANTKAYQYRQKTTSEATNETNEEIKNFVNKQAYTKNATLEAIRQSTLSLDA